MRRLLVTASIITCALLAHGCKQAGDLPKLQREQQQRDQLEALQSELDEAKSEVSELRAREAELRAGQLGVPTAQELVVDIGAASALLVEARAKLDDEQPEEAATLLRRAGDVLTFTAARLPRAQITVRLARAADTLSAKGGAASGGPRMWDTARFHVEEARDIVEGSRSRPMHLDVAAELQRLLDAIDNHDAKQAQAEIAELLKRQPSDEEASLARVNWCISTAIEALARNGLSAAAAWAEDAERDLGTIVDGLGGSAPTDQEDGTAAPAAGAGPASARKPTSAKPPTASQPPAEPGQADASRGTGTESAGKPADGDTGPPPTSD